MSLWLNPDMAQWSIWRNLTYRVHCAVGHSTSPKKKCKHPPNGVREEWMRAWSHPGTLGRPSHGQSPDGNRATELVNGDAAIDRVVGMDGHRHPPPNPPSSSAPASRVFLAGRAHTVVIFQVLRVRPSQSGSTSHVHQMDVGCWTVAPSLASMVLDLSWQACTTICWWPSRRLLTRCPSATCQPWSVVGHGRPKYDS